MATAIHVHIDGVTRLLAALDRMSPARNRKIATDFLVSAATLLQRKAQQETIIRGGKGPPHPTRLTSRTGTGRRSITVDRSLVPAAIEVGSDLGYMALHEEGGHIAVPGKIVREHTRTRAFGRRYKPFVVPSYYRSAHGAAYPARPWLKPAIALIEPEIEALLERTMLQAIP